MAWRRKIRPAASNDLAGRHPDTGTAGGIRIDKWLYFARFFKTRTLASAYASTGHVRLSRAGRVERIHKPKTLVHPGDTLTFMKGERVFVVEIIACGARRGPAKEAFNLYIDHSPPPPPKPDEPPKDAVRQAGAGRPTKKDRRALEKIRGDR